MSVWTDRDQPVLQHLISSPPEHNILWTRKWSDDPRPDLPQVTEREFHKSVLTLHDAGYVAWDRDEGERGGGWNFQGFLVTGAGKQALGLWPRFDVLASPEGLSAVLDTLG
jgi:hypothetical protein